MSHFSDSRPPPGLETQSIPTSLFSLPTELQVKKQAVSNLTKNLMSSSTRYVPPHMDLISGTEPNRQPPLYSASVSSHNNFSSVNLLGSRPPIPQPSSLNYRDYYPPTESGPTLFGTNANYIPLGHNTPTAVSSSYTSNYSHTPSFNTMAHGSSQVNPSNIHDNAPFNPNPSALPGSYKTPAMATTTVSMDFANPKISLHNQTPGSAHQMPVPGHPVTYEQTDTFESQLSNSFVSNGGENGRPIHPSVLRNDSSIGHSHNYYIHHSHQSQTIEQNDSIQYNQEEKNEQFFAHPDPQYLGSAGDFFNAEPDHYMSYKEFLQLLNQRQANAAGENNDSYEEHFNIVDYSVDELITMLACLLTKIIDTNDKLHPNHFDNTIAARQKVKEEKKLKKLEKQRRTASTTGVSVSYNSEGISTTVSHLSDEENSDNSSDDEEDELKNRYLVNVLAFHGTNVPGISLHAYLTRVLKYCPVTNEVFLSLLVYFDRIAKRANNLRKKKKDTEVEGEEPEQLFVMDSYNIHRLIILGITVSSKFFSDIFYKNLRYAKVGGLPLEELNYLELQFLLLLDFKLMISVEDLQNYGDLLLKFWKREQLASEINKQDDVGEDHML